MSGDRGFTLLELIVVIIIIGVLGTLGFTQYQLVLERSRTAEALIVLGSLRKAQEAYYLEYGSYARGDTNSVQFKALSITAATSELKYFQLLTPPIQTVINATADPIGLLAQVYRKSSPPPPKGRYYLYITKNGTIYCDSGDVSGAACKGLGYDITYQP